MVAGTGTAGYADGPIATAQFNQPAAVAIDAQGTLYVADRQNHRIRKITAVGVVSTLAGSGASGYFDHPVGTLADFSSPQAVLLTAQGNLLVADTGNGSIRQISPTGAVTTFAGTGTGGYADGPAGTARFSGPIGLAQDAAGNVYVADADNYRIRRIDTAGNVTTIAGSGARGFLDGPAATARFFEPQGLALDAAGNLYIADAANNRIRRLSPAGVVSTYAGVATAGYLDGPAATARFRSPTGLASDSLGNLYVADRNNQRLRRIEATTGQVVTVAGIGTFGGQNGPALSAQFANLNGLAVSGTRFYVSELSWHRIRRVDGLLLGSQPSTPGAIGLQLEAFPNPAGPNVTWHYYLPRSGIVRLTVLDALGRVVATPRPATWQATGWQECLWQLENQPPGLYLGRLETTTQTITTRLTVMELT